ncbi:hypothetical protein [Oceanobacillus chungangensis]|uniref:DNA-binding protein n=1 Tax=Oceanobacillus chungangensis TaxID=1229152 RepID=A0A3D8PIM7_9BACI|nr:hypothetical protein [Oceanobacillus chungangensis]RDW15940.1 hypothetical protein CWR45_15710 [Oceanobacillus chungangensis]
MEKSNEIKRVNKITVKEASEFMGVSQQFIRLGLQQKILPFGVAVKMSSVWTYHISRKKLFEYIGE